LPGGLLDFAGIIRSSPHPLRWPSLLGLFPACLPACTPLLTLKLFLPGGDGIGVPTKSGGDCI
jgi:hypothetical protein